MSDVGYVQLAIRLTPEKRQELKLHAVTTGESINTIVSRAIDEVLTPARSKGAGATAQGEVAVPACVAGE